MYNRFCPLILFALTKILPVHESQQYSIDNVTNVPSIPFGYASRILRCNELRRRTFYGFNPHLSPLSHTPTTPDLRCHLSAPIANFHKTLPPPTVFLVSHTTANITPQTILHHMYRVSNYQVRNTYLKKNRYLAPLIP